MDKILKTKLKSCSKNEHFLIRVTDYSIMGTGYNRIVRWCSVCGKIVVENDLDSRLVTNRDTYIVGDTALYTNYIKRRTGMTKMKWVAKFLAFSAAMVWVFLFLFIVIATFDFYESVLITFGEIETQWFLHILDVWYLGTCAVIGAWVALKGFRIVGSWEKVSVDVEEEENVNTEC